MKQMKTVSYSIWSCPQPAWLHQPLTSAAMTLVDLYIVMAALQTTSSVLGPDLNSIHQKRLRHSLALFS